MSGVAEEQDRTTLPLPVVGMVAATLAFAFAITLGVMRAGQFEYPLDDVYIHLAIAEQILTGNYGVNPGEAASAASSILYPLILTPLAGTAVHWLLPLVWNGFAVVLGGYFWGQIMREAGYARFDPRQGVLLTALGPLAFNLAVVAYTGMENALHIATTLALFLGLFRALQTGRVGPLLIAAVLIGPMLRYEAMAGSLLAAAAVAIRGRPLPGLGLGLLALAPVAVFTGFLLSLGLAPLPNSVLAKLANADLETASLGMRLAGRFGANLAEPAGLILFMLSLLAAGLAALPAGWRDRELRLLLSAAALAGLAHLTLGKIGWMDRYEAYALVWPLAAIAVALPRWPEGLATRGLVAAFLAAQIGLVAIYQKNYGERGQWAAQAVLLQTEQMARFAHEYHDGPVAVNDLGKVSFGNPHYVLDLWGLASPEALAARGAGAAPGWAAPLAEARGVTLAMIYDDWVGQSVGADWVRLGTLIHNAPAGQLGGLEVAFYATNPSVAAELREKLEAFRPTLPPGADFVFAGSGLEADPAVMEEQSDG